MVIVATTGTAEAETVTGNAKGTATAIESVGGVATRGLIEGGSEASVPNA